MHVNSNLTVSRHNVLCVQKAFMRICPTGIRSVFLFDKTFSAALECKTIYGFVQHGTAHNEE